MALGNVCLASKRSYAQVVYALRMGTGHALCDCSSAVAVKDAKK